MGNHSFHPYLYDAYDDGVMVRRSKNEIFFVGCGRYMIEIGENDIEPLFGRCGGFGSKS